MKVITAAKTDAGCVREANEDAYYIYIPQADNPRLFYLLAVADGMGGETAGKEASQTAIATLRVLLTDKAKEDRPIYDIKGFLLDAFRKANEAVYAKGKELVAPMGTTLSAILIDKTEAYICHVGDSRAYLLREGRIMQLTEDHTLAEQMIRKGKSTRQELRASPMRSMLTRCIGTAEEVTLDEPLGIELLEGDVLLLCTDGLSNLVDDKEIIASVSCAANLKKACASLVSLARRRGGYDNITVVAASIGDRKKIKAPGVGRRKKKMAILVAIALLCAVFFTLLYLFFSLYRFERIGYENSTSPQQRD